MATTKQIAANRKNGRGAAESAALRAHCLGIAWSCDAARTIARTLRLLKRPKAASSPLEPSHAL